LPPAPCLRTSSALACCSTDLINFAVAPGATAS
jgi:hypothetical protein